jgi:hypothetical protein
MNLFWLIVLDEAEQQEVEQKVGARVVWAMSSLLEGDEKANLTFDPLILTLIEVFHG